MPEFDAYLMVDWSANSKPKTGKNSIWYCMAERVNGSIRLSRPENPRTRHQAVAEIRNILVKNVERRVVTLVGSDFPYGYPRGFAAVLGLDLQKSAAWRPLWDALSNKIKDDTNNKNNRFVIADEFNKRISSGPYPFWGCPRNHRYPNLSLKKPSASKHVPLCEYRLTEERALAAQSAWKLLGHGAVGGQALLGIPYVASLRDDSRLNKVSRVWPFETGLARLPSREGRDWFILHVEIYPSIIKCKAQEGEIKDAAQVRGVAMHFARLDQEGCLAHLFERPPDLSDKDRRTVEREEGWILGVQ